MKENTRSLYPLLLLGLMSACPDVDPSNPEDPTTGSASVTFGGTTGELTDGGAGDDGTSDGETSVGAEETGDPPIVCNPEDKFEPNEIEDEAWKLPNITDEDTAGEHVESILAGEGDVDWFAYMGSDVAFAYVDPASGIDADMEVRLCLFVECINGNTKPINCVDSIYEESPDLTIQGCCNTGGSAFVSIDLYCDASGDESAYVFMRVDQGRDDICVPYEITYHF